MIGFNDDRKLPDRDYPHERPRLPYDEKRAKAAFESMASVLADQQIERLGVFASDTDFVAQVALNVVDHVREAIQVGLEINLSKGLLDDVERAAWACRFAYHEAVKVRAAGHMAPISNRLFARAQSTLHRVSEELGDFVYRCETLEEEADVDAFFAHYHDAHHLGALLHAKIALKADDEPTKQLLTEVSSLFDQMNTAIKAVRTPEQQTAIDTQAKAWMALSNVYAKIWPGAAEAFWQEYGKSGLRKYLPMIATNLGWPVF